LAAPVANATETLITLESGVLAEPTQVAVKHSPPLGEMSGTHVMSVRETGEPLLTRSTKLLEVEKGVRNESLKPENGPFCTAGSGLTQMSEPGICTVQKNVKSAATVRAVSDVACG
jgi:hypothetical protein